MLLSLILLFAFFFYKTALSFFFVSDDFLLLNTNRNLIELFRIDPLNNHYTPIIASVNLGLVNLFGLNPLPYHLFVILVHLFNVFLVYLLAIFLIKNKLKALLSALLFAFFFANYEVIFWYGAINSLLMVTFYVLSLIFLIKFNETNRKLYLFFFSFGSIIALLIHEYAISIIPVSMGYWYLFSKKNQLKNLAKIVIAPAFLFGAVTILKALTLKMSLVVREPSIAKFIAFFLRSTVYLFVPNPFFIDKLPNVLIPIIFLMLLAAIFKLPKTKLSLFLLLWTASSITIYSATSAPQARYFYISAVPVVLFILTNVNFTKKIKRILSISYLLFVLFSGLIFINGQKYYWRLNTQITKNVIVDLKKYSKKIPPNSTLYFVNLPDSSSDSIWKAYVFRAGFREMLNIFADIRPEKIVYLTSDGKTPSSIEAPYISNNQLAESKKKGVVFKYEEYKESVVLLK